MHAERPEKATVRRRWLDHVEQQNADWGGGPEPLYLTLPGAEGRDLTLMVERGVLGVTEVGSLTTEDQGKVVAVESSGEAVLSLQRLFPGLKILEQDINSLVRGQGPIAWPQGDDVRICRARIINLDLNTPLRATVVGGQLSFPTLEIIRKFAQVHAVDPPVSWTLFLTLHGEIHCDVGIDESVRQFLANNFGTVPAFGNACRAFLGEKLFNRLEAVGPIRFTELARIEQQRVLMALVPKAIARRVVGQGWRIVPSLNWRYGGTGAAAPMVTWVLRFEWDTRVSVNEQAVYQESVEQTLAAAGFVDENGEVVA
jgi:hypothetical protein